MDKLQKHKKVKKFKHGEFLIDKALAMYGLPIIKNIKTFLDHCHLKVVKSVTWRNYQQGIEMAKDILKSGLA